MAIATMGTIATTSSRIDPGVPEGHLVMGRTVRPG